MTCTRKENCIGVEIDVRVHTVRAFRQSLACRACGVMWKPIMPGCCAQLAHEYLARSAGLRDVREFTRGMTPMQYKKASKAIAGIRVRAPSRPPVPAGQSGFSDTHAVHEGVQGRRRHPGARAHTAACACWPRMSGMRRKARSCCEQW